MRRIEVRDLDGPNLFLLTPAIKLELGVGPGDLLPAEAGALLRRLEPLGVADESPPEDPGALGALLAEALVAFHERAGAPVPNHHWTELETPGHHVLAFSWDHRRFARGVAEALAAVAAGEALDVRAEVERLRAVRATTEADDRPLMIRDAERRMPIVAVTGTNGKTTTTRLIAHTLRLAGFHPGWTTTAGVYLDGEKVLEGDYSGPSGARAVLAAPGIDVAVLETARGGILLRGLAFEHCDVSVFLNISADHLGLHGVQTVDGLAAVKSVVVRATKAEGWAVLNADDPRVRGTAAVSHAPVLWTTQDPANPQVVADLADGGRAVLAKDGWIVEADHDRERRLVALAEVPIAFGGAAPHMVENALAAAAACLALGRSPEEVAAGLRSFGTDPAHNPGRNDLVPVKGGTVVIDYAHNPAGLERLLRLARGMVGPGGRLIAVVGSAGDRTDETIRELGRVAGRLADAVVVKETRRYLRGRADVREILDLFAVGIAEAGGEPGWTAPSELDAVEAAIAAMGRGDVVAVMSFEDPVAARALAERIAAEDGGDGRGRQDGTDGR